MADYICADCGSSYPSKGLPYQCTVCGGYYSLVNLTYDPELKSDAPGIWTYQKMMTDFDLPVSYLGEGQTPLVERVIAGQRFFAKLESLNPSGSFKDRNAAILTSYIRKQGVKNVVEDSSGNAGAALALYASAFGISSRIFVPADTSGPKIRQIHYSGADVVYVPGSRGNAQKAAFAALEKGNTVYASHAAVPFGMAAYATIAFEIFEQLGKLPDRVYCPIGHGSLFYGVVAGFEAIGKYLAKPRPAMIGLQPAVCAPLVAEWNREDFTYNGAPSLAEGTLIANPARRAEIMKALIPGFDDLISVSEDEIAQAHIGLNRGGIYVEPTSAMVFAGLKREEKSNDSLKVMVFTGNGLKSSY